MIFIWRFISFTVCTSFTYCFVFLTLIFFLLKDRNSSLLVRWPIKILSARLLKNYYTVRHPPQPDITPDFPSASSPSILVPPSASDSRVFSSSPVLAAILLLDVYLALRFVAFLSVHSLVSSSSLLFQSQFPVLVVPQHRFLEPVCSFSLLTSPFIPFHSRSRVFTTHLFSFYFSLLSSFSSCPFVYISVMYLRTENPSSQIKYLFYWRGETKIRCAL